MQLYAMYIQLGKRDLDVFSIKGALQFLVQYSPTCKNILFLHICREFQYDTGTGQFVYAEILDLTNKHILVLFLDLSQYVIYFLVFRTLWDDLFLF